MLKTILVEEQTKSRLDSLKIIDRETYDSVIQRAVTQLEKMRSERKA